MLLVLYNRTTLEPEDSRYDVGFFANWTQVFGVRALLWGLPVRGDGPGGDGLRWPLNPEWSGAVPADKAAPGASAVRQRWGMLWVPFWVALQWEHFFCCGCLSVGVVRRVLRLCLIAREQFAQSRKVKKA